MVRTAAVTLVAIPILSHSPSAKNQPFSDSQAVAYATQSVTALIWRCGDPRNDPRYQVDEQRNMGRQVLARGGYKSCHRSRLLEFSDDQPAGLCAFTS